MSLFSCALIALDVTAYDKFGSRQWCGEMITEKQNVPIFSRHTLIFRMTIKKASIRMFEPWAGSLSPTSKAPFLLTIVSPTSTLAV